MKYKLMNINRDVTENTASSVAIGDGHSLRIRCFSFKNLACIHLHNILIAISKFVIADTFLTPLQCCRFIDFLNPERQVSGVRAFRAVRTLGQTSKKPLNTVHSPTSGKTGTRGARAELSMIQAARVIRKSATKQHVETMHHIIIHPRDSQIFERGITDYHKRLFLESLLLSTIIRGEQTELQREQYQIFIQTPTKIQKRKATGRITKNLREIQIESSLY